jgi:hypothetical protein
LRRTPAVQYRGKLVGISFQVFKEPPAQVEDFPALDALDGNSQIKCFKAQGIGQAVNKIRLIIADQGPVVGGYPVILIHIFVFHISRPRRGVVGIVVDVILILKNA